MNEIDWKPDILGAGYGQHVLDLGTDPDGEGRVEAVLVRREQQDGETARGAVLYVHGFSDYFFQKDLADFFANRGLAFYALELRKCGRARRPGQTAHYVSDLAYYNDELDRALEIITGAHPGQPVIMAAHSTGGLVVPLWLNRRRAAGTLGPIAGAVLNSPWLDLQGSWMLRGPVTQAIRLQAKRKPFQALKLRPGVYGKTLHVSGTGEWEFDTDLKPLDGFPVTLGWLNAIRRAHTVVHRGIDAGVPLLVLRSGRSHFSPRYSPRSDRCDLVLDTQQIGRWAGILGSHVTIVAVKHARHDVFLSIPEARERAYTALGKWLDDRGMEQPRVVSASREISARPETVFELIADPSRQPEWDGSDNLASADGGQRVRRAGDVFTMTLTNGGVRENHVTEFTEGRLIAWTPSEKGKRPPGHLWRWELEPAGDTGTRVTVTYDWTRLTDRNRLPRARWTTAERLQASLDRLAATAEQ